MTPIPLVLVGDGWQNPTGLGRIARDLYAILRRAQERLGIDVYQIGYHPPAIGVQGQPQQWSFSYLGEDWGASTAVGTVREYFAPHHPAGIVFYIWDPARVAEHLPLLETLPPGWQLWIYPAIDGENAKGEIGGPAAAALRRADRLIAYGRYGAEVIHRVTGRPVSYLPHGISPISVDAETADAIARYYLPTFRPDRGHWLLGCVATNQPRKDLSLFMRVLSRLRQAGEKVWGWLHTDRLVGPAWSLPELADIYDVAKVLRVTTGTLDDRELAGLYAACTATIAPGRGEGFGYPIVESLAAGTPVVHVAYAGGQALTPAQWQANWHQETIEGAYAIRRPVVDEDSVVEIVQQILRDEGPVQREYCKGAVAHLDWQQLGPRWVSWVKKGLEEI